MKMCIAVPERYAEVIRHFQRVADISQNYFCVELVDLADAEEEILGQKVICPDEEKELKHNLFGFKIAHGYKESDFFISFFEGQLLDPKGNEPYFVWSSAYYEEDPGVSIISLYYLDPSTSLLTEPNNRTLIGQSIELNILAALTFMSTSLESHYETVGCVLDYCSHIKDINVALEKGFFFCDVYKCKQKMQSSEAGRAILDIASGLVNVPYHALSQMVLMPRCFKMGVWGCPIVSGVIPKTVFVGIPFSNRFVDIYQLGIKLPLENMGYSLWKADEHESFKDLMCKVCGGIQKSEFAIVDLSEKNPNVLFELGICYALGRKALIVVSSASKEMITDLKGMEFLSYDNASDLSKKLSAKLPKIFL